MITLYQFGPAMGLVDPSPFVMKADLLLKLSGLSYRRVRGDMRKAPKGKLPYIDDDGQIVPDSTLIRLHLADKHGLTLEAGLSEEQKALAWSVDCMLGDHFYWGIVHERWMVDENFARGPSVFFKTVPALLRGLVTTLVRRKVRANLQGQGMGRFSAAERLRLLETDVAALSALLGDKPYFMGEAATWIDASVYAFVSSALTDAMGETASRTLVAARPNLVAYAERLRAEFYG
ncbi:glutathione S-transferase family protein [Chromobacterium alkanivorans]|uniref:glutathione S-transferase family protein n=1 Tax=Chromobacterium alkanivorans TaxID=1071719 RepID=UPI001967D6AB|nr:glutathione S-transferase family protein [Chromobacterium alkanivorans]MBN3003950.1 glutathione S-transferase family protein [Chromobacterium alkanivorans]